MTSREPFLKKLRRSWGTRPSPALLRSMKEADRSILDFRSEPGGARGLGGDGFVDVGDRGDISRSRYEVLVRRRLAGDQLVVEEHDRVIRLTTRVLADQRDRFPALTSATFSS